ncbi:MAG: alpha/beta fold hydrolase [Candidatus Zixiibacteriota bacterium]
MLKKTIYIILAVIVFIAILTLFYNAYVQSVMIKELVRMTEQNLVAKFAPVRNDNDSPAILFIHGYGGSPYDFKPLIDTLDKLGYTYYAPLLPGHGQSAIELENSTKEQWFDAAEKAYHELKANYETIYVIGFSMGGAISVLLAARFEVDGLILINPYFRTTMKWWYLTNLENTARLLSPFIPYVIKPKKGQINDPDGLKKYESLKIIPTKSTRELNAIGERAQIDAGNLNCRILWFHAVNDDVASYKLSRKVFKAAPSTNKKFINLERSNHVALYDYDSKIIIDSVLSFISPLN